VFNEEGKSENVLSFLKFASLCKIKSKTLSCPCTSLIQLYAKKTYGVYIYSYTILDLWIVRRRVIKNHAPAALPSEEPAVHID
jgi:hypothetical protein